MKKVLVALVVGLSFLSTSAFADSIKIFDATPISETVKNPLGGFTGVDIDKLWTFAQKEVSLTCDENHLVTLSAPIDEGNSLIVDNLMHVNDINICDRGTTGVLGYGVYSCFKSGSSSSTYYGQPIQNVFKGIGLVDISNLVPTGMSTVVFSLKDFGSVYGNTSLILNVSGCTINGSQGCTPGYWKNHLDSWLDTDYVNSTLVSNIFNTMGYVSADATLLDALKFKGGKDIEGATRILLRAAVAALLNSSSSNVAYPIWSEELILDVNGTISTADRDTILLLADTLDLNNNLGCPLN